MSLNRDTAFTWLGHATVLIETPGGKRILLDPWTSENPACPEAYKTPEALGKLDLILVTHLHGDHCGDAPAIAHANPEAPVVTIVETAHWLGKRGIQNLVAMNKGGTMLFGDIAVTMTHAFHSSSGYDAEGNLVYGGEPTGFIVRLENGFTFYAAGDTCVYGDMALLKELYQPELALLPIGDHFTMGPKQAALAIRLLGVSHVLPIHHGTFPQLTGTPEALKAEITDFSNIQSNINIHALQPGETLR